MEFFVVVDEVVECICVIGVFVLGGFVNLVIMVGILEIEEDLIVEQMVQYLIDVNLKVLMDFCLVCDIVVEVSDFESEDLMIVRIQVYEKIVWML